MSLAVLGRESLDELERLAREHFSSVRNKNLQPPVFEECSDTFIPLDPKELGTQVTRREKERKKKKKKFTPID